MAELATQVGAHASGAGATAAPATVLRLPLDRQERECDRRSFEESLAYVRAHARGGVEGLFGPDSLSWHVMRELGTVLIGGGYSLLLQFACPAVSAGVRQHSRYAEESLARSKRTFQAVYAITFGDLPSVLASAERMHARHQPVRGVTDAPGAPPRPYRALDPTYLLWVYATLLDTQLRVFDLLVRPLALAEKRRLYDECRLLARCYGIPLETLPPTYEDFQAYFDSMLEGPLLQVGAQERALKEAIFALPPEHFLQGLLMMEDPRPARALFAAPGMKELSAWLMERVTAALLPPRLREAFGLRFGRAEQRQFQWALRILRPVYAATPPALRFVPAWHRAIRRVAEARGEPVPADARLHRLIGRAAVAACARLPLGAEEDPSARAAG